MKLALVASLSSLASGFYKMTVRSLLFLTYLAGGRNILSFLLKPNLQSKNNLQIQGLFHTENKQGMQFFVADNFYNWNAIYL